VSRLRPLKAALGPTDVRQVADEHAPVRRGRRARIEASAFAAFAALHAPGAAVALGQAAPASPPALLATTSVVGSLLLWVGLVVLALRVARHDRLVPRGLLVAALSLDTVVLVVSGLSPPRLGNITAASVGLIAVCAAAALLSRARTLPAVVLPAVVGQAVLLHAADASTTAARLVADVVTTTAATAATTLLIAWLEHERRSGQEALARAATTDPLTGLLNRRGLSRGLPSLAAPATGAGRVHVVVLDVDHFKDVNDRRGHDAGDELLVVVARALQDCARRGDLLVRWGGEELAWVARWGTTRDAAAAAEGLRVLVAERTRDAGERVTISAGVAVVGAPGEHLDAGGVLREALVRADQALYRAKAAGRDRVEVDPGVPVEGAAAATG